MKDIKFDLSILTPDIQISRKISVDFVAYFDLYFFIH